MYQQDHGTTEQYIKWISIEANDRPKTGDDHYTIKYHSARINQFIQWEETEIGEEEHFPLQ